MWQSLETLNNERLFQKMDCLFLAESAKIENTTFSYKTFRSWSSDK